MTINKIFSGCKSLIYLRGSKFYLIFTGIGLCIFTALLIIHQIDEKNKIQEVEVIFYSSTLALLNSFIEDQPTQSKYIDDESGLAYSWRVKFYPHFVQVAKFPGWNKPVLRSDFENRISNPTFCLENKTETCVFLITGPGTAFPEEGDVSIDEIDSDVIFTVEVRDSGTYWMEPEDFDIRTIHPEINSPTEKCISGVTNQGFHVGF